MKIKILINSIRVLVAITFIFSGFVKLVDPMGSAFKFEEYFGEDVLNIPFLIPYALPFSIFLIVGELVLGIALLIGFKPKWTSILISMLTLVFLFLTGYSAVTDKVTDCGCFGDAITLTPWETFYKNIILIALTILLVLKNKLVIPLFKNNLNSGIIYVSIFGSLATCYYVLNHLPLIDFRAYAIGKNIPAGMEYIKNVQEDPPVHDFIFESFDTGKDYTEEILTGDKVMLIVVYNLNKAELKGFPQIKKVADKAIKSGYKVYGVSGSDPSELEVEQKRFKLPFKFLFGDGTTLKTMIRSNPGIIILSKGTVTGKWNWSDVNRITL